jgi:hypothetical protein
MFNAPVATILSISTPQLTPVFDVIQYSMDALFAHPPILPTAKAVIGAFLCWPILHANVAGLH